MNEELKKSMTAEFDSLNTLANEIVEGVRDVEMPNMHQKGLVSSVNQLRIRAIEGIQSYYRERATGMEQAEKFGQAACAAASPDPLPNAEPMQWAPNVYYFKPTEAKKKVRAYWTNHSDIELIPGKKTPRLKAKVYSVTTPFGEIEKAVTCDGQDLWMAKSIDNAIGRQKLCKTKDYDKLLRKGEVQTLVVNGSDTTVFTTAGLKAALKTIQIPKTGKTETLERAVRARNVIEACFE